MTSISDLYVYYCHRCGCRPNSRLLRYFADAQTRSGDADAVRTLDLSSNYVGAKGIVPVLDTARHITTLTHLDLSNNMLETAQLQRLVDCVASHPCITTISLRNNRLCIDSVEWLVRLLEDNARITQLHLDGNELPPSTLRRVAQLLDANREQQQQQQQQQTTPAAPASCHAEVRGHMAAHESGGHYHFATWWHNPQYRLRLHRGATRVALTMRVTPSSSASRQCGLVVMRSDGVRRVVCLQADTIVAESVMDATRCTLELALDTDAVYAVMPYTFRPGGCMDYVLSADVVVCVPAPHRSSSGGSSDSVDATTTATTTTALAWRCGGAGCVTLERLDERYDWCTYTIASTWSPHNAGGAPALSTWRLNDMYRVHCHDSTASSSSSSLAKAATPVTVAVLLTTSADPDDVDARCIGVDVVDAITVARDACDTRLPPLHGTASVRARSGHAHATRVFVQCTATVATLDCFVVPSTAQPGQTGAYTLTLFSTSPLHVTQSSAPHAYCYRSVHGRWLDAGGCDGATHGQAWLRNPAVCVRMSPPPPPPSSCAASTDDACLHAFLQLHDTRSDDDDDDMNAIHDEDAPDAAAAAAQHRAFVARHGSDKLACCLAIVPASTSMTTTMTAAAAMTMTTPSVAASSPRAEAGGESYMAVTAAWRRQPFYLVPMLQHAGQRARFTLHLYATTPFVLDGDGDDTLLACMARAAAAAAARASPPPPSAPPRQLCTRHAVRSAPAQRRLLLAPPSSFATDVVAAWLAHDMHSVDEQLAAVRAAVARACATSRSRYSDRAFPRGASSLWLAASASAAPAHFPRVYRWRRASRLHMSRSSSDKGNDNDTDTDSDAYVDSDACVDDGADATTTTATATTARRTHDVPVRCLANARLRPPCSHTRRHVFASVMQALAAKPAWLCRVWSCYDVARGLAQFRFYKNASWCGVTIDDGVVVDAAGALCMGHSAADDDDGDKEDVFYPLAEKAYAKLHRCYEALETCVTPTLTLLQQLVQTLSDCSGGYTTVHALRPRAARRITMAAAAAAAAAIADNDDDDDDGDDDGEHDHSDTKHVHADLRNISANSGDDDDVAVVAVTAAGAGTSACARRAMLWRALRRATLPHVLVSLLLCSEHVAATALGDRTRAGLLPDRLYGVVDVRVVAGRRLVRLRNWRDGVATVWRGKWAAQSERWTHAMRRAVRADAMSPPAYVAAADDDNNNNDNNDNNNNNSDNNDDDDTDTLWMSFDEVLYYYTHMLVTEVATSVARVTHTGAATLHVRGAAADTQRDCPQFVLTVVTTTTTAAAAAAAAAATHTATDNMADAGEATALQLHIGLHQDDARMSVTREQNATARYAHALGLAVFAPVYAASEHDNNNNNDNNDRDDDRGAPRRCERLDRVDVTCALRVAAPVRARDVFVTLPLPPPRATVDAHARRCVRQFVVVPLASCARDAGVPYTLTARCTHGDDGDADVSVSLSLLTPHTPYAVDGAWTRATAGGAPDCALWRHNPQYHLDLSDDAHVVIQLLRRPHDNNNDNNNNDNDDNNKNDNDDDDDDDDHNEGHDSDAVTASACRLGFTVHTTHDCHRLLHYDAASVCAMAQASSPACSLVATTATLSSVTRRRGVPYVIVVHGTTPAVCGAFTLQVLSTVPARLRAMDARVDWHRCACRVRLCGGGGGGDETPSWRCSPQLALTFPIAREGRVVAFATRRGRADVALTPRLRVLSTTRHDAVPVHATTDDDDEKNKNIADDNDNDNNDEDEAVVRRVLVYDAHDVVAESSDTTTTAVQTHVSFELHGGVARRDALVLVVHATAPCVDDVEVDVEVYAMTPMALSPVREWACVRAVQCSWELGTSAGGCRAQCASWSNNPFFGLMTLCRRTRIVALLLQRPRGAEQPARRWRTLPCLSATPAGDGDVNHSGNSSRSRGNKVASSLLLRPLLQPVLNRDRCTAMQLDLVRYDDALTPLQSAGPRRDVEVVLEADVRACRERPYLLVPCTVAAAHDGDFCLLVFADAPIDLFRIEHERVAYV